MTSRPRISAPDPAFLLAVANALRDYRDGQNPEKKTLADVEVAARLGVSKSTVSKYLHQKQLIGGEPLRRMLTVLGISIAYQDKEISARELSEPISRRDYQPDQIAFVFDTPCQLDQTDDNIAVTIERKEAQRSKLTVHITLAG